MAELLEEKFYLIDQLLEAAQMDRIGMPTGLLTHAVVNTIDLHELVRLYVQQYSHNRLIGSNIIKRLLEDDEKITLYDYLFSAIESASYIDRLRFRKIIDVIIEHLDEERQLEYFSYFYRSQYRYEKKAALNVARYIWNVDIENLLVHDYYKYESIDVLLTLIELISDDQYLDLAKSTFKSSTPNYIKAKLVKRLKGFSLNDLAFLKTTDPGNFLGLIRYTNEVVSDKTLLECYERVPTRYKPFALWNIGKLGKWELIKPELERYVANPAHAFAGFSEILFK